MHLTSNIDIEKAADVRADLIGQARAFAIEKGEIPENADKWARVFDGPSAPCLLRLPEIHIAHVNGVARQLGVMTDPLRGFIEVNPGADQAPYKIVLAEADRQHQFLVAIKRMGQVDANRPQLGVSTFWSYNLVILGTSTPQPLVLALDLNSDGDRLDMSFSRRLYFPRRLNQATQQMQTVNRLRHLQGVSNIEALLLMVAGAEEFPIYEARKNRPNSSERQLATAVARGRGGVVAPLATPYANATGLAQSNDGDLGTDPFGDQG